MNEHDAVLAATLITFTILAFAYDVYVELRRKYKGR